MAAGDQNDVTGRSDGHLLEHLRHVADQNLVGVGKTFTISIEQAVIDDSHVEVHNFGDFDQRYGDVTGAYHDQSRRRGHHFEEYFQFDVGIGHREGHQLRPFRACVAVALAHNGIDDLGVTDSLGAHPAVTDQAFGARLDLDAAFRFDDRGQYRRHALLGDLDKFLSQRAHFARTASWSRSFHHGSMNTFMMPPHTAGLSDEMSSSKSTRTVRGFLVRIASIASRFTSASPQPPPMVPKISP